MHEVPGNENKFMKNQKRERAADKHFGLPLSHNRKIKWKRSRKKEEPPQKI